MAEISSHSPEFPSILNVLVIDTDLTLLEFIKKTCNQCSCYQVMTCSESLSAVNLLRERKTHIHLILIEVHMPTMDGYEFLQFVQKEKINVPVVMISEDDSKPSISKAIELGACDYRIKPLCDDVFKNMWIHVFIKFLREKRTQKNIDSFNSEFASPMVYRSNNNFREADDCDESKNSNPPGATGKDRVVWSPELHAKFLDAIRRIGLENAVPKKILEAMNMPNLKRGHVASHLQKYRKFLKQMEEREREQRQNKENEKSLVSGNKKPRVHASEENSMQPLTHPGLTTCNMGATRERPYDPNVQAGEHFHAQQQTVAHDPPYPLAAFPNISITNNFPQSSRYELCSAPDAATLQINPMQHPQVHPINLPSSSITISENSASVPHNYNFRVNVLPQSIPGENNIGQVVGYQYNNGASMYYPQPPQNAGFSNGAVRSFAASTDIDDQTINNQLNSMNNGHHNP